jgi:phage terminase large subunit-like protein
MRPVNRPRRWSISTPRAPDPGWLKESLASLSETDRAAVIADLSEEDAEAILYDWPLWARDNQLAPLGEWSTWIAMAGRGWGKTRVGAEWVRGEVEEGRATRVALVAPTAADARDVMVEGESGLLAVHPPNARPEYEPSKRRVTWPNGAIATLYSADEPERLRGPQHDLAWADELAAWRYLQDAWDMLMFGLRLGQNPRVLVTTTPKPRVLLKQLIADPATVVTYGRTDENRANLAPSFFTKIVKRYEGTRLGRQELGGELLEDIEGALWTRKMVEAAYTTTHPKLERVVVAIDPAMTSGEESDETGIVVVGMARDPITKDPHGYVLEDLSGRYTPYEWAGKAITAYKRQMADRVVAEVNNGGDMVEAQLRMVDRSVSYKAVHASRGKRVRAEPVAALYEQGRVHHVGGLPTLEDQMCAFVPDDMETSPDRVDALVWALTELIVDAFPLRDLNPSHWAKAYA